MQHKQQEIKKGANQLAEVEALSLPQQPVFIQCVQSFLSHCIDWPFRNLLV